MYCSTYQREDTELQPSTKRLFAHGSDLQLHLLQRQAQDRHNSCCTRKSWFLAGLQDSKGPGYPRFHVIHISDAVPVHKQLCYQYPGIFEGIGKLKGVEIKASYQSVFTLCCSASPVNWTPWVSPVVVVPTKNGDVCHLCLHADDQQRAINQGCHPTPTTDNLIHTLNGATVFSKLDLRAGYYQLTLAPENRYATSQLLLPSKGSADMLD